MSGVIHELAPGLSFIQRGWLSGNHLVAAGPQPVLVDSGYIAHQGETLELLARAGLDLAGGGEPPLLVTTHLHCDHVGAHAELHRQAGCRIVMSPPSRRVTQRRDGRAAWPDYYGQGYEWFPVHGELAGGDSLDMGGMAWEVLDVPGHAGGQIALFAPDNGWLYSADAVWDGDFGVLTPGVEGWDAPFRQRETLLRLAKLPVTRVLPGHGAPIADGLAAIQACLERVERFISLPRCQGADQVRKILLYTVLMRGPLSRRNLAATVLALPWLVDASAMFFGQKPAAVLDRYLEELLGRELLHEKDGLLSSPLPA